METSSTRRVTVPAAEEILGLYFPALDHGFVSLVDYSGGDLAIERAARVSYGMTARSSRDSSGLLNYLFAHAHSSPFEMCELTLHMGMPIFVARQLVRHRTASLNEISARYSELPMLFYTPEHANCQYQSTTNKQGRAEDLISDGAYERAVEDWEDGRGDAEMAYHDRLDDGLSRELARIDLPLSTYTSWYWKCDLSNLFKMLSLRVDAHAQWETRQFGNLIAGMAQRVAPLSYAAWREHALGAVIFSYTERQVLARYLRTGLTTAPMATPEIESMLGKRGTAEFVAKLQPPIEPPSFDLDLTAAKDAQHYLDLYTPKPRSPRP
jgi:thymidylate synthase (FAD)